MAEGLRIVNILHERVANRIDGPAKAESEKINKGTVLLVLASALIVLLDDEKLTKRLVEYLSAGDLKVGE